MRPLLDELHSAISAVTGQSPAPSDWAPTPNRSLGDVSFPCFKLSKAMGKAPPAVAQELAPKIKAGLKPDSLIREITATGPYLNVFFDAAAYHRYLTRILAQGQLGASRVGEGKTVTIDFSSPNIAKEIGLHHLRSTGIGNALSNIAALHGYKVERINYLGDWGTSHGKNIMALKMFGSEEDLKQKGLPYILDLYVRYNHAQKKQEAEGSSELADLAKAAFKKLEDGDPEYRRVWSLLREASVREFKLLYDRLGIRFDHYDGESLYEKKLDAVVDEITQKMGTRHSDGALVCDLPGHKIPVLLKKDDGASLYITRDLAAAEDRWQRFHYAHSWYVVAVQQKLHFEQLFGVLGQLGKPYADRCEHVPFGMLSFGAKTMKSREGNIIFLKDVIDEANKRALEIIRQKNPELPDAERTAEMIGTGAILFTDLSQHRSHDISFEWEKALSFEGDTAPFVQYVHARCCSLQGRTRAHFESLAPDADPAAAAESLFADESVRQLLGDMAFFQTYSERALSDRDPSQIATAVLNVAKSFNQLYHRIRFLGESSRTRLETLLALADNTRRVMAHGLGLLGIRAPHEM